MNVMQQDKVKLNTSQIPLVVDLDGTLILSDITVESMFLYIKRNPLNIFVILYWLMSGKACLKSKLAERVDIDIINLPFNSDFVGYLQEQYAGGRNLYLATASHMKYAKDIASISGMFKDVFATENNANLSGKKKRDYLVEIFGDKLFDYAGNSHVDIPVWKAANSAVVVNPELLVESAANRVAHISHTFRKKQKLFSAIINSLRPHQWLKNLLIFVPVIAAHRLAEIDQVSYTLLAFVAFSLCSSSAYLINDLLDVEEDRLHPTKYRRPFASGTLSLKVGIIVAPILLTGALLIAWSVNSLLLLSLSVYFVLTLSYSLYLKRIPIIDVLFLSFLYTIRILAGSAAITQEVSFWLLAFSLFIFFSMATMKRHTELVDMRSRGLIGYRGRGYLPDDIEMLTSMGVASGYVSILVLALYIHSPEILENYSHPQLIWVLCPLLLFWLSRAWLRSHRGEMHDDPIIYAFKDRASQLSALIGIAVIFFAS